MKTVCVNKSLFFDLLSYSFRCLANRSGERSGREALKKAMTSERGTRYLT